MVRLFVAIDLPADIRRSLASVQAGLPGARWLRPENLHLTLRFIGEVDRIQARDIDAALCAIEGSPFEVALEGAGTFGSGRADRVLWAGVKRNPAIGQLKSRIDNGLRDAGCAPDPRKFAAHVTLARLRQAEPARVAAYVADNTPLIAGAFSVSEFVLFSSHLGREGAIHTAEARYPLAGRP